MDVSAAPNHRDEQDALLDVETVAAAPPDALFFRHVHRSAADVARARAVLVHQTRAYHFDSGVVKKSRTSDRDQTCRSTCENRT